MTVTKMQYDLAKMAERVVKAKGEQVPDELKQRLIEGKELYEPAGMSHALSKKKAAATMYLVGASLRQVAMLMGIARETAYRYIFNELKGQMPERRKGEKGVKQQPTISEEIVGEYWRRLAGAPTGLTAYQLAEWIGNNG